MPISDIRRMIDSPAEVRVSEASDEVFSIELGSASMMINGPLSETSGPLTRNISVPQAETGDLVTLYLKSVVMAGSDVTSGFGLLSGAVVTEDGAVQVTVILPEIPSDEILTAEFHVRALRAFS